ncbi:hypothetical protein CTZ27_07830 [Streptomyces griseocarneus]|nr:hypothetical protein CTZ27_07830 [Streptomyces griseocarneus]
MIEPAEHPEISSWAADFPPGPLDHLDFLKCRSTLGEWYRRLDGDTRAVERMLNRLALADVIDYGNTLEDDAALMEVARTISKTWHAALSAACPGRTFDVTVHDIDDGPVVSFARAWFAEPVNRRGAVTPRAHT